MPIIANPVVQYVDSEGLPLRFAKMYITDSGTTTPAVVFQDEDFSTEHTYPIVADADGFFPPVHFDPTRGLLRMRVIAEDGDLANPPVDADPVNDLRVAIGDFVVNVQGNPTGVTPWLGGIAFTRDCLIPSDLLGSRGKKPKGTPTADYPVTVVFWERATDTLTTLATITCNHTTKEWSIAGTGFDDILPVDGDELDVYGPADADATMADFGFTFAISLR